MFRKFAKGAAALLCAGVCLNFLAVAQTAGEAAEQPAAETVEAAPPEAVTAAPEAVSEVVPVAEPAPVLAEAAAPAPAPQEVDYLLMPITAEVRFITTGGSEVRADWTEAAKDNFEKHMELKLDSAGKSRVEFDPAKHETDDEIQQLLLLWEVVAASTGTPMPHKGKKLDSNQNLTLGKTASKLADLYGADKAVFVNHYSQIESGGVFLTQVMIGAATGYVPPSANVRATTTRVVDLETGKILSTGSAFGGDPRDLEESLGITTRMLKSISLN
jgi:hypothetical protein